MFFLYQIILTLILLFSPIIIIIRLLKKKKIKKDLRKNLPSKKFRSKRNLIWFHGASVGELLSIIPLIKYYEKKKNIDQILVTSSTVSSSKVLKKFKLNKTIHQFYPMIILFYK